MTSKDNIEKNLLQQITYLTRLISQSKNTVSRRTVLTDASGKCKPVLRESNDLKNKYRLTRLNSTRCKSESSSLVHQSCDNLNPVSCTKLKALNKKCNFSAKLPTNVNKSKIDSEKFYQPECDISVTSVVKKCVHVNREKLFQNLKTGCQANRSSVHVNPTKFKLKPNKLENKLCDAVNNKITSKSPVHINPKFNKSHLIKGETIKETEMNSLSHSFLNDRSCFKKVQISVNSSQNCGSSNKIHLNKNFIYNNSGVYDVSRISESLHVKTDLNPNLLKLPLKKCESLPLAKSDLNNSSIVDNSMRSKLIPNPEMVPNNSSVIINNPDLLRSKKLDWSASELVSKPILTGMSSANPVKLLKLRKAMLLKNKKHNSTNCKRVQNLLMKNSFVQNHFPLLPVHKYKNRNKIININRASYAALRKVNNRQEVVRASSINLISGGKNFKLVNNKPMHQRLQPALKRSNSNSKSSKLVKSNKNKWIRTKLDNTIINVNNSKGLNLHSKNNQNLFNDKRSKRVWVAPSKTTLSNLESEKLKINRPPISTKSTSPYKYNSKINVISNKQKYTKINSSLKNSQVKVLNPSKNTKNSNNSVVNFSRAKNLILKQNSLRRISQSSNLVSVSRTKLIRKSSNSIVVNKEISSNKMRVNNLLKNRLLSLNNKSVKPFFVQPKLTPTLRTARSVKTKYKLIRNSNMNLPKINWNLVASRNQKLRFAVNYKTRINKKIPRTSLSHRRKSVTIGGIKYHRTQMKLRRKFSVNGGKDHENKIFRNKGESFRVSKGGRSLRRINSSEIRRRQKIPISRSNLQYRCSVLQRNTDFAHYRAVQAKQKSIAVLTRKLRKSNEPCLIFNRLGRCSAHERGVCNRLHDKKRIAICKRFLQGSCEKKDCLLSHDVGPSKMPTCRHYLAGICVRDDCPYLHVKVNSSAPICIPFLQGFCPDAGKCKKRHVAVCPEFEDKGVCVKGKSCPYPHPKSKVFPKSIRSESSVITEKINSVHKAEESKPVEVSESDSKPNRYYCQQEFTLQEVDSLKRNIEDDEVESLAGNEWLRKRPRVGDLPGFIPLDADCTES